ncbi:MAG: mechanosensitive ion channel family protein, partial [Alphaproteobacteria bacterium]|nr:mechanosensitive ion channel family protein [Alphaproteobacteria bacterium]
ISGLILDVEHTYKTGDWIKLNDNTIGRVLKTTWRHIEVETEYKTLIVIPNGRLVANSYENLSHYKGVYAEHLIVSIDYNITVERVERILTDGLLSIKEVVETGIYAVFAEKTTEGGMNYTLRYGVRGYDSLRLMRHKVIKTVVEKLHASNLKISETFGEYILSKAIPFSLSPETSITDVLRKVSLFAVLTDNELENLSSKVTRHLVDVGHELITKNDTTDSLFVIAEGVVDVIIPLTKNQVTKDHVVATLGEGNFVGDRSLLLGEPRSATVRARTKVLTYEVNKEAFQPILQARPSLINDLSKIIVEREQDTSKKINDASQTKEEVQTLQAEIIKGMKKFFGL